MVEKVLASAHDVRWLRVELDGGSPAFRAGNAISEVRQLLDPTIDLAIVHGDRHEILGAAVALNIGHFPIAHIGGGDVTEGSQDDCFRHAITKLSHLHFVTNSISAARVIQMGEDPDLVHVTGDPGVDRILATPLLGRDETFAAVGLATPARCLLVSFHPNTLGDTAPELNALSEALSQRAKDMALVLIGPNADAGGDLIRAEWWRLAATCTNVVYHENLPAQVYLSLMKHCDAMVGNSSAGFYEAPYLGLPVVNVGDRQQGRIMPENIGSADAISWVIAASIKKAMARGRVKCGDYYGDGHAAERIAKIIGGIKDIKVLLRKRFFQLNECAGLAVLAATDMRRMPAVNTRGWYFGDGLEEETFI
jgi:UDP-N-acetylglucosamine 2-epimerase (non-hydrolysing)/GDP/UDP-N,N'-diacetylbacillosamine 2-epimerase (hydrolysing)